MQVSEADRHVVPSAMHARMLIDQADGLLIDWDGCLAIGNRPHAAALHFLARFGERSAIVSNNSTHLPGDIAALLAARGIVFPVERIVLAGHETIRHVAERDAGRVMVFGDRRLRRRAKELGINVVRDSADVIVLLRDTRFNYARLERAANALLRGARLVVANIDLTHPGACGRLIPETGALLAAILACAPHAADDREEVGKPGPRLFLQACATLGIAPQRAVMIGDNPDTDIAGARGLGMPAILIGPRGGFGIEALLPAEPAVQPLDGALAIVRSV